MPRNIETTVYKFDELSDDAKERARQWWHEQGLDYDWWDSVYDDAMNIGKLLGIDLDCKPKNNPKAPNIPAIFFDGFYTQGCGACFSGSYKYAKGAAKALKAYAPQDAELIRIAKGLQQWQRRHFYKIEATCTANDRYMTTRCEVFSDRNIYNELDAGTQECVAELLTDFAHWIYRRLEAEYDYLNSDEQVDESIRLNEYEFTEEGEIV